MAEPMLLDNITRQQTRSTGTFFPKALLEDTSIKASG